MSSIPQSRIVWLVQMADRSSCTNTPLTTNCDGIMSPGDRVVMGDNYMAFMDLTRENNYGSGGGGVLRGVWLLVNDGSGNKNFKYIINASNRAQNNLFPIGAQGAGDANEILVLLEGESDPFDTYRATSSQSVTLFADGIYDSASPNLFYHYHGTLTRGDGGSNPYSTNIGTSTNLAKMYYHLYYWFYNNYYPTSDPNNAFRIKVRASIDVCGSTGCFQTRSINTAVFSLSISKFSANPTLKVNYFKPVSHSLISGNYPSNCIATSAFFANNIYNLPTNSFILGNKNTQEIFSIKYKVDNGNSLSNFRINIRFYRK